MNRQQLSWADAMVTWADATEAERADVLKFMARYRATTPAHLFDYFCGRELLERRRLAQPARAGRRLLDGKQRGAGELDD